MQERPLAHRLHADLGARRDRPLRTSRRGTLERHAAASRLRRALALVPAAVLAAGLPACGGDDRSAGTIEGPRRPEAALAAAAARQVAARDAVARRSQIPAAERISKRVLFGDLHAHSTYSFDAFLYSLPLVSGEGAHPPADACDFARYCSALDFYSLTDHAENLTPAHWAEIKATTRQCNARASDPANPDIVAFTGFEWTQVGMSPESHWGHKNVIFPGTAEADLPSRPIGSVAGEGGLVSGFEQTRLYRWIDPLEWREYADFVWLLDALAATPRCPQGVDVRALPDDCSEAATTPGSLFEKLRQWDLGALVIPHGTAWGAYVPPGSSFDKQLTASEHDPEQQTLVEIMSGHGSSEEYRAWREFESGANGEQICPAPTPEYLPCCWRAGEIMRQRCGDLPAEECEARVAEARRLVLEANVSPHLVFPDSDVEDWLDCGQCRDCFKPAFSYRPQESVQYAMALSNFDEPGADGDPLRFRWGFLASSDNHKARPGTGYKQYERRRMADMAGARSEFHRNLSRRFAGVGDADPRRPQRVSSEGGLLARETERVASFFYTGGLVAVHADRSDREAIWGALQRREVYGTSGPRILLWFDLLNAAAGVAPMGSEHAFSGTPRFEVRAVGALKQKPGCPQESRDGLSPERLERLCRGECYHPGDERHAISAVEIVRIRPQARPDEVIGALIEDPWRRFACAPDLDGCSVVFEDPDYERAGRDVLYYARALQAATPAVNGATLRSEFDAQGNAVRTRPCYGDYRTPFDDDCLAPVSERAWSSPIFLNQTRE
jgi:hypothetical protein